LKTLALAGLVGPNYCSLHNVHFVLYTKLTEKGVKASDAAPFPSSIDIPQSLVPCHPSSSEWVKHSPVAFPPHQRPPKPPSTLPSVRTKFIKPSTATQTLSSPTPSLQDQKTPMSPALPHHNAPTVSPNLLTLTSFSASRQTIV